MGLVMILAILLFSGPGEQLEGMGLGVVGLAFRFSVLILVLVAGAVGMRLRIQGKGSLRSNVGTLETGAAVALTAPLLLFASRPDREDAPGSRIRNLSRPAFPLFLFLIALGFALQFALDAAGYHDLAGGPALVGFSFSAWALLGCGLLFMLSPWPAQPRIPRTDDISPAKKAGSLVTIAMVGLAMVHLVLLGEAGYLLLMLIAGGVGVLLLLILVPWPKYPPIPRLGPLPDARRIGPVGTLTFLAVPLIALGFFALGPFLYVVSGGLFASEFSRSHIGGALDQPSLNKWFFLFLLFSANVLPYAAAVRWMSRRKTRFGFWAFTIPTAALCLMLLSVLTVPYWWVIQYIGAMGWTAKRFWGLVYGLGGYVAVILFFAWSVWPGRNRPGAPYDGAGECATVLGSTGG
jgi:hypothetical protein